MQFTVRGEPFFTMGGQAHNSSAYNKEEIASAIAAVKTLHGNTLEAPVYWEQIEPQEGTFDFTGPGELIKACREADLKLIILWFATWKNGEMRYVPEWVKKDKKRFVRVIGYDGVKMQVLSSYGKESMKADKKAFAALCAFVKSADPDGDTVIAYQIENEPGILGSDRDYSPLAEKALEETVPPALLDFIEKRENSPVRKTWAGQGQKRSADWLATFGFKGYEYREAWSIASYINEVALEGQKITNLPMYTNAWLERDGWHVPGFYPAAGPIASLLDIWKCAAPALGTLAPDNYCGNRDDYFNVCDAYDREDNPLFIPESGPNDANAIYLLSVVSRYNLIGFAAFGIESILNPDGSLKESAMGFAASFACIGQMMPLIYQLRASGKIHPVIPREATPFIPLAFEKYTAMVPQVEFGLIRSSKDYRHNQKGGNHFPCFGIVAEATPHEFYLCGQFHLHMVSNQPPGWLNALKFPMITTPPDYLSVEEGYLDGQGRFTPIRKRNGDEAVFGSFWVTPECGVVRVRLNPAD